MNKVFNFIKELKTGFSVKKDVISLWESKNEDMLSSRIILNRIQTPDGTILTSRHRHDFKTYLDKNGLQYSVDGGFDYLARYSYSDEDSKYKELSVYSNSDFEVIRESLEWGSYGKRGDQPLTYKPISQLSNVHIKNIVNDNVCENWFKSYLLEELAYRKKHKINIKDEK